MKKFRIIAAILALIMTAAAFTACSASKKNTSFKILDENFGYEEYAVAFRKGDFALAEAVQGALDAMYADGTGAEISTKWFGSDILLKNNDYASEITAGSEDGSLQYILDKGTFILGLDDAYPPMGFRDETTNEIVGIDIDLAREVCKRLGVELVLQPISWDAKDMELDSKNIDCIWNGLTVNESRVQTYTFSKPYMANAQVILVPDGSDITSKTALAGKTVGTQSGSAGLEALQGDEIFAQLTVSEYADYLTAYLDLKAGRIDAIVGDKTLVEYIMTNQD